MDIKVEFNGNKKVNAIVRKHVVKTDQPIMGGGEDSAVSPFELFLASLATCAGIYVKGFCDNRGIDTSGVSLIQHHEFDEKGMLTSVDIDILLPQGFPEKYQEALIHVAGLCKVKQTMANPPAVSVKAVQVG